jgi:hypothetical protein
LPLILILILILILSLTNQIRGHPRFVMGKEEQSAGKGGPAGLRLSTFCWPSELQYWHDEGYSAEHQ